MRLFEVARETKKPLTPSQLDKPTYLRNFPQSLSTSVANNAIMKELLPSQRNVNLNKAYEQFMAINNFITTHDGVVYFLPSDREFQDQIYVSNVGCYLPHIKEQDTVLVANFRSPPRKGEEKIGEKMFELMGYKMHRPPTFWEGQAELRFIRENIYIGGYGFRSVPESYKWMEKELDMKIPTIENKYGDMYHLDCGMIRLTEDKILYCKKALTKEELTNLQKYVEVVDVPLELVRTGSYNGIRCGKYFMFNDPNNFIVPGQKSVDKELVKKIQKVYETIHKVSGLEPVFFDVSEFKKSGADLGCTIMHLNYFGY